MFASSQTDKNKAQAMSDSVRSALGKDQITTAISGSVGGTTGDKQQGNAERKGPGGSKKSTVEQNEAAARIAELLPSLQMLRSQLKQEIDSGMLQVSMEARGVVVSLRQAAFFPPGQDTIDAGTYVTIQKLATVILAVPNKVRLEGHTDAVPIHNARYRSNWELSAARSCWPVSSGAPLRMAPVGFAVVRLDPPKREFAKDDEEKSANDSTLSLKLQSTNLARKKFPRERSA